jgi:hypothetical protein
MLQLLFTCRFKPTQRKLEIEVLQRGVWRCCKEREIGGFFVQSGVYLLGLFEGADAAVIGQVEHLIRKNNVENVHVVREIPLKERVWDVWNSEIYELRDFTTAQYQQFVGLAQIVEIAVEADRKGTQQH